MGESERTAQPPCVHKSPTISGRIRLTRLPVVEQSVAVSQRGACARHQRPRIHVPARYTIFSRKAQCARARPPRRPCHSARATQIWYARSVGGSDVSIRGISCVNQGD